MDQSPSDKSIIERHWNEAVRRTYDSKEFKLIQRAWAAGLFDGEGHASARKDQAGFDCKIEQSSDNRYVLEQFMEVVGVGKITDRPRARGNGKPSSYWAVTNQKDLTRVWDSIGDFLCKAKRDQIARAMTSPIQTMLDEERELPAGMLSVIVMPKDKQTK